MTVPKKSVSSKPLSSLQKEKNKFKRIERVYGLSREQYDEIDLGHCPICTRDWSDIVRPVVDHDHVSGIVRGLLCIFCNRYRVGRLRDHDLVRRIADYLQGPHKGWVTPPKPKRKKKKT